MDGPQPSFENLVRPSSAAKSVPIEHLDYAYIRECKNVKELEKILQALRSGEHGFYPYLLDCCVKRIETLAPQSKVLRQDKPPASMYDVGKDEWQKINSDIKDWATEMGNTSIPSAGDNMNDLPPIRKPVDLNTQGKKAENEEKVWGQPSAERIRSSDYQSWDKFDADAASEEVETKKNGVEKPKQPNPSSAVLDSTISTEGMTDNERVAVANMEKNKGNEAFKAGDFDEAVQYYTRSISVIPSAPSYNNRSLARIKLGQYSGAQEDCTKVLELEPENIKALLRRGTARKALKQFAGAKEDLEAVLKAEANNKQAMDLLADILQKEGTDKKTSKPVQAPDDKPAVKGRRMVIQEVEGDSESEGEDDGKGQGSLVNGRSSPEAGAATPSKVDTEPPKQDNNSSVTTATPPQSTNGPAAQNQGSGSLVPIATPSASNDNAAAEKQNVGGAVSVTTPPPANVVPPRPLPNDVIALKDSGNELFKAGQYGEAMEKYSLAITKLLPERECFPAALGTLYGNRGACNSKTGHLKASISDCDMALGLQPYSVKTYLRRGAAYEGLEKYRHAYIDYQAALKLDTVNQSALNGSTRMIGILSDQDGPRWREKLPPSPSILGLPLQPPNLNAIPPSNTNLSSATPTSNVPSKPAQATSAQSGPSVPHVKGQKVKNQEVKHQEPEVKPSTKSDESQRSNAKPAGGASVGEVKVTDGSGIKEKSEVKGMRDPTPTIDPNLSKEANFQMLKSKGNALVQQGDYATAAKYYTSCIEVDSNQLVSYTNRALCFIKLLKGTDAESDCTKALELNDSNVKALYRRALARKMLQKFSDSARDLTSLLKIEPNNLSAKKELDQVKEMWRQELKNNQQKPSKPDSSPSQAEQTEVNATEVNKPTEVKPTEVKPTEVKPTEVKPTEVKPTEVKPTEVKPTEVKPTEVKPTEVKPTEVKPAEVKPTEVKPTEVKPAEVKPTEVKPTEVKSEVTGKRKKKGKRMQIQETEGSSDDNEKSSPKITEITKDKKGSKTPRDTGNQKGGKTRGMKDDKTPRDNGSQKVNKTTGGQDEKISVPKLNKVTAYEFLQVWTSLKRHKSMKAYADLLKQMAPEELPDVLTNKLDGDMLVIIIKAICEHLIESDGDLSFGLLANLPKVERFKVVGLFLSSTDKKRLRNSLKKLDSRKTEAYTEADIDKLRQLYSL